MNVLYFADPNSIHDKKWIYYFLEKGSKNIYILPRFCHYDGQLNDSEELKSILLDPIKDFSFVRFYQTLATAYRIKLIIEKYKIDIIHILYSEPNALWCLFRNYFSLPMIVTTRGTDVLKTIPETFRKKTLINYLVAPAYSKAFRLADWVTGTSKAQLLSIASFSGRTSNVSIIRTGVKLGSLLSNTSRNFPANLLDTYILFPRFIKPIYNHEFCLEAIELLPSLVKRKYSMVFVGKDDGDIEYQRKLETKMNAIKDVNFVFLPRVDQETIFELYKRASVVVMTPISDGSPVTAMEALACGSQLILGPLLYDKELFNSNVHQLGTWDVKELASLLTKIVKEKGKHVSQNFLSLVDSNREMRKVDALYNRLLSQRE